MVSEKIEPYGRLVANAERSPPVRLEMLAIRTARMPTRKIPSNVPAPPIEAIGAPKPCNLSRLSKSAPMRTPRLPLI